VLSSFGLPLPPTCPVLTASEDRSYFASTINKNVSNKLTVFIFRSKPALQMKVINHKSLREEVTAGESPGR
jgi:hypothetical protein